MTQGKCNSCGGPSTVDFKRYPGGSFCENRGFPARQELPAKTGFEEAFDKAFFDDHAHSFTKEQWIKFSTLVKEKMKDIADAAHAKGKEEGRAEGAEMIVKAVELRMKPIDWEVPQRNGLIPEDPEVAADQVFIWVREELIKAARSAASDLATLKDGSE
jgi:hypothetical protein